MAQYMHEHLGQTFPGAVTGVNRFGVFVGLENGVEGMVALECLGSGPWDFDEDAQVLSCPASGAVYTFGTPLEVVCAAADPVTGRIDFTLPGSEGITPGIFVHNTHTVDNRRGRKPCFKKSSKGSPAKGRRHRSKRR